MRKVIFTAAIAAVAGCSAIPVAPTASQIPVLTEKPSGSCRMLGEAIGSQGNSFTSGLTSDVKLIEGARNQLRNKAAAMGGNYVWLQGSNMTARGNGPGANNSTVVGVVYSCADGAGMGSGAVVPAATPSAPTSDCEACKRIGGG